MKTTAETPTITQLARPLMAAMLILAVAAGALVPREAAAQGTEVAQLYNKGIQEMERGQFKQGLAIFQNIIQNFGAGAFDTYGPAFGLIHYHAGLCQMQLGKYKEGGKQFEVCYKDFPNRPKTAEDYSINHYHQHALYQWGRCEQAAEEYEGALKLYQKFLEKTPDPATYSRPECFTNMGICYVKINKLAEGSDLLGKVFGIFSRLKGGEKRLLFQGFIALGEKWIENKKALDGIAFMDKYEFALSYSPYDMWRFGFDKQILKLGQSAVTSDNGLEGLGLRFLSFIPRTEDIISEISDKQMLYGGEAGKKKLQVDIDKLTKAIEEGKHMDITTFRILAYAHEKMGNYRGGFAVYDYMAGEYPKAVIEDSDKKTEPFHPEILYNAARTSFAVGDLLSAQYHALTFLKKYPGHKLEEDVQSLLLEQLFRRQEYDRCLEITKNMLPRLTPKTPEHDLCLFVKGGSLYYDGQYEEAKEPLDKHLEMYEKSQYREETSYYQAGNLVKLLEWEPAAKLLDTWMEKYKESELRPYALLDRATCHFMENENDPALAVIKEIEEKHQTSSLFDSALNLKGNVLQGKGEMAAASEAYLAAKELAENQGHEDIAVESLMQLISVAVKDEKWAQGAKYYDEFNEKYSGNLREPNIVANALAALGSVEPSRAKEGLEHMETMIVRLGKQENVDLEKAVGTYGKFYIEFMEADHLVSRIKEIREQPNLGSRVQAWLMILLIDTLENEFQGQVKAEAEKKAAFAFMRDEFDKKDLAPYQLGRIGAELLKGGQPELAATFYDEIVRRPGDDGKIFALEGLGKIYVKSPNKAKQAEGVKFLMRLKGFADPKAWEEGLSTVAGYYSDTEQWPKAEQSWFNYVDDKMMNKYNAEAWYKLGYAREMQAGGDNKKMGRAVSAYLRCFSKYKTQVLYSCPAWRRASELQYKRGEKKNAYKLIAQMTQQMAGIEAITDPKKLNDDIRFAQEEIKKAKLLKDKWAEELGIVEEVSK